MANGSRPSGQLSMDCRSPSPSSLTGTYCSMRSTCHSSRATSRRSARADHQVESNLPGRSTGGISRTAAKLSARAVAAGRRAVTATVMAQMLSPAGGSLDHAGWRHAVRQPRRPGYSQPEMPEPKVQGRLRGRPRGSGMRRSAPLPQTVLQAAGGECVLSVLFSARSCWRSSSPIKPRRQRARPQGHARRRDASVRRLRRAHPRGRGRDDRHRVRPGTPLDPHLRSCSNDAPPEHGGKLESQRRWPQPVLRRSVLRLLVASNGAKTERGFEQMNAALKARVEQPSAQN